MTSKRTFYRNVITIEVLSEEPLSGDESLLDIEYLINDGPCSGKVETTKKNEQIDGQRMARLLEDQASDTEFFGLDGAGNDIDDDEGEELENGEKGNDFEVLNTQPPATKPSMEETMYEGSVSVELTGLVVMRQRRTLRLEKPLPQSAVEDLARETAGDHVWDYQGMQDATIEVSILS